MSKRLLLGCGLPLLALGALGMLAGRFLFKSQPILERSETVSRGNVEIKVVETGTIEALRKVEVKSKVGGRILQLFTDEGRSVRQGQPMATIDPQEINSQVAALRAQLAASQARLAASRKTATYQADQTRTGIDQYVQNVAAAKARLQSAQTQSQAQPEMRRQSIAVAQANLEAAKANLKAVQSNLDLLLQATNPEAIVSAQASFDQAKAQAENMRRNVGRQQQLLTKGFVAKSVVESAEADASVSEAHQRDMKEKLDRMQQSNELAVENARSQVAGAQSQVRQMEAALLQARLDVQPETRRRDLESARAAYEQARAQLASARTGRTQDLTRLDEVQAAAADVEQIQNQLRERLVSQGDTTLLAPMAGLVTRRYAERGDLITSAISSFSSGTPVFQISDMQTMLVKVNVNEVDISKLRHGLLTEVTIDAERGVLFKGHLRKVAPAAAADATSGGTSGGSGGQQSVIRFPVEVQIDRSDPRLKPGMSAHCAIIVSRRPGALRLPSNSIRGTGSRATVQIVTATVKDGKTIEKTTPRDIVVGLRGDDFVEIVSGIREGEKVRPLAYTGPSRKTIDMGGPD